MRNTEPQSSNTRINSFGAWKIIFTIILLFSAAIASPAQTLKTLVSFDGPDGWSPTAGSLVQGFDGNFYGTTYRGGTNGGYGTVFKINSSGRLITLHSFNNSDGNYPQGLVQAEDGNLYGTTYGGGANDAGTVFKITPQGTLTTLYSFCARPNCTDGANPWAVPIQAIDGNLYGTTVSGGPNSDPEFCPSGCGTVFKISTTGTLISLHSFCGETHCPDGYNPGSLLEATNGTLYGTTSAGGNSAGSCNYGCGTIFRLTPGSAFSILYSFVGSDGAAPGGLAQGADGNLYGITAWGGANSDRDDCPGGCGTVFKINPAGALSTLYSFCAEANCSDGYEVNAGLVQGTDGNFYGTTTRGGSSWVGTIFELTSDTTFTIVESFAGPDGAYPYAGLVQGTDGMFYGTTYSGGADYHNLDGTVFSLDTGLGRFVKTLPTFGKVGVPVIILGNHLTGATSVTFGSVAATFSVVSDSEITTVVPVGATTGRVGVQTPAGRLHSNVIFRIAQ